MRVTFDSHVLGKVVAPEKRRKDPDYLQLKKINFALRNGALRGLLCETIATLEAIGKRNRFDYFANRIPKTTSTIHSCPTHFEVRITFAPDHDRHPGLHNELTEKLRQAKALGVRLLYVPSMNVQLPKLLLQDQEFYDRETFMSQRYVDRFWEVSQSISARGCGLAVLNQIIHRIENRLLASGVSPAGSGLSLLAYAEDKSEREGVSKAIAEWADADLVAAHIAREGDLFCTEDQGKSAKCNSIFSQENKRWLEATYGVCFKNIRNLAMHTSCLTAAQIQSLTLS